jgi:hypothetical protein
VASDRESYAPVDESINRTPVVTPRGVPGEDDQTCDAAHRFSLYVKRMPQNDTSNLVGSIASPEPLG